MVDIVFPHIHKRRVTGSSQVQILDDTSDETRGDQAAPDCAVCQQKVARYTCPRCFTPYCSFACFPQHHATCSEQFYRERVTRVNELEVKAKRNETQQILQRQHVANQQSTFSAITGSSRDGLAQCGVPREELYELLISLESGQDERVEKVLQNRPNLRAAIDRAISSNHLNEERLHEWVLDPWHPWWVPKLEADSDSHQQELEDDDDLSKHPSLDEYLLGLPRLPKRVSSFLKFHVLEALFGVVETLRLYHGPRNAQDLLPDSVMSMLEASTVLRSKVLERPIESVADVLQHRSRTDSFSLILHDVIMICHNPRYVARCLMEAFSLLRAGSKYQKDWKRVAKKVDFLAAWNQINGAAQLSTLIPFLLAAKEDGLSPTVILESPLTESCVKSSVNTVFDGDAEDDVFRIEPVSVRRLGAE